MSEITPEGRVRLRAIIAEHGIDQAEDRIILRILNALEAEEASVTELENSLTAAINQQAQMADGIDKIAAANHALEDKAQKAEAEVARLTKERDWLAERCSELCEDDEMYSDPHKTRIVLWKEAARRAVADSNSA